MIIQTWTWAIIYLCLYPCQAINTFQILNWDIIQCNISCPPPKRAVSNPGISNSLAVCEVRLVSCSHASAFGGRVVCPTRGGEGIFLPCSHVLPLSLLLIWTFSSTSRTSFSCLCFLSGWLFCLRIFISFLRNHTPKNVKYNKYKSSI